MSDKKQNACLMVSAFDDESGNDVVSYIPLNIDISVVKFFVEHGTCENKQVVAFDLATSADEFWENMWDDFATDEIVDNDYSHD